MRDRERRIWAGKAHGVWWNEARRLVRPTAPRVGVRHGLGLARWLCVRDGLGLALEWWDYYAREEGRTGPEMPLAELPGFADDE